MLKFPYYTQSYLDATSAMEPENRATFWWLIRLIYNSHVDLDCRVEDFNETTRKGIVFG